MPQKTVDLQQKVNELQKAPVNSAKNARYLHQSLNPQVNQSRAHSSGYFPQQHKSNEQEIVKRADKAASRSCQYPKQQTSNAQKYCEISQVLCKLKKML